jgi:hypothetical protein
MKYLVDRHDNHKILDFDKSKSHDFGNIAEKSEQHPLKCGDLVNLVNSSLSLACHWKVTEITFLATNG